jgi:hypothetical protein
MGAPPLSQGVLAQALAEENFTGCPITVQILGEQRTQQQGPCTAQQWPMHPGWVINSKPFEVCFEACDATLLCRLTSSEYGVF